MVFVPVGLLSHMSKEIRKTGLLLVVDFFFHLYFSLIKNLEDADKNQNINS